MMLLFPIGSKAAMNNGTRIGFGLLLLVSGLPAGCGSTSPSTPSPVSATALGRMELTTNRPDGGTLVVKFCPGEANPIPCTEDLQMTFSVVLNRDIDRARVWTEFYSATGQLCAGASTAFVPMTAGTAVTVTAPSIYLSLQGGATSQCGLPAQTTRMVAHLLDWASHGDVLTEEFSKTYTFTGRP